MRIGRWIVIPAAVLVMLSGAGLVRAVTTRTFDLGTLKDFRKAHLEAIKVSSTGELSLGHASTAIPVREKEVWASLVAADGHIYFSTGNSAALYRIENGKAIKVFGTEDVAFSCLAQAKDGKILIGSVPSGKIYQVDASGQGKLLAALPASYVWSLAVDAAGTIYAGTGPEGVVYALGKDFDPKVYYDARDGNILAVALSPGGELWAGSALKGLLYRIPRAQEGHVEADFGGHEIRALRFAGPTLYIALNEGQAVEEPEGEAAASRVGAEFFKLGRSLTRRFAGSETHDDQSPETQPQSLLRGAGGGAGVGGHESSGSASRVDMLGPEGRVETVVSLDEGPIMDLAVDSDGMLILAMGGDGSVLGVKPHDEQYLLHAVGEAQAVTLALDHGRLAFIGCANSASAIVVEKEQAHSGRVTCAPMDAQFPSVWGEIRWDEDPAVKVETRSGNTRNPDHTWSSWGVASGSSPVKIPSPPARYLQLRMTWGSMSAARIRDVRAFYLPQNQRPVVEQVEIKGAEPTPFDPSELEREAMSSSPPPQMPSSLDAPDAQSPASLLERAALATSSREKSVGEVRQPGETFERTIAPQMPMERPHSPLKTVRWVAGDKDGDALVYRLFVRGLDDDAWVPITPRDPLTTSTFAWNTESVPDGHYVLKVVASDERVNSPTQALSGEKSSAPFVVDNTRPRVEAVADAKARLIRGSVKDELSVIARIESSVDGQPWTPVEPQGRLLDSLSENFAVPLPDLAPGAHSIAVRAADSEGNVGSARIIVRIPKP